MNDLELTIAQKNVKIWDLKEEIKTLNLQHIADEYTIEVLRKDYNELLQKYNELLKKNKRAINILVYGQPTPVEDIEILVERSDV